MSVADAAALHGTKILVTGGAGSIGSALVLKLLGDTDLGIKEVLAFDNNEYALACLQEQGWAFLNITPLRVVFGDIRDSERLKEVLRGIDIVVHTAAMKRVEMAELNVVEAIKVNIIGTINLLQECRNTKVGKLLLISSDKAVPAGEMSNYGATKLLQERITLLGNPPPICGVSRFGNVTKARGNVFERWERQRRDGKPLSITHPDIRRFLWTTEEAVNFIINCLKVMHHRDIFVPRMQEEKLIDLAKKLYGENVEFEQIGLRPGEVLIHKLMTEEEMRYAVPWMNGWVIRR